VSGIQDLAVWTFRDKSDQLGLPQPRRSSGRYAALLLDSPVDLMPLLSEHPDALGKFVAQIHSRALTTVPYIKQLTNRRRKCNRKECCTDEFCEIRQERWGAPSSGMRASVGLRPPFAFIRLLHLGAFCPRISSQGRINLPRASVAQLDRASAF
jgi:hypothetical protein